MGVQQELLSLRPSDILTKNKLARSAHVNVDFAETLLVDLFKDKYLQMIIRVDCNDDEFVHSIFFNNLHEFYAAAENNSYCDQCGAPLDWKNAKVGFKKGIYR